ncbi:MAG: AAA family ATPase [Planctomycetes bacterium]|nr:AAA family ATPase [Planctomycetota bacterium]
MYCRRILETPLSGAVSRDKVRILLGARQTGKTALLRHLLPADRTRFFDLQDTGLRRRFEAEPSVFAREVKALPRAVRNVVVDEIQKVPDLLEEVQRLYDQGPSRWQFFLTGSSARRLRARSANLLPGRSHAWHLFPVCGWEVAREEPPALPAPSPRVRSLAHGPTESPPFPPQDLPRLLRLGSLPGIRSETAGKAALTLETYVGHFLEEEIRREALVREMGPFTVFLRLAAAESGRQTNLAKLSQESGIPATSLKNYYQVLVDTFVGHWMPAYAARTRKRLLTTPRFYLFDVGVRNAAAEVPLDARLLNAQGGPLLEHWVAGELRTRAAYAGRGHRVSFWRTTYGVEVDFVWESPREDVPIEVKWTERPTPGDARHLEIFLDEHRSRARRGYLVCRCPEPQQLTRRVRAVPWHAL